MHISVGDSDDCGGDAASAELHGVCVGAGAARHGEMLKGDFGFFCGGDDSFVYDGVNVWSSANDGAFSDGGVSVSGSIAVGMVCCPCDVDGESGVWFTTVGACGGSAQSDFFLDGSDGEYGDIDFLFCNKAHGFENDEGTDSVVERTGDDHVVSELLVSDVDGDGISDGDDFFGVFFVFGPDVDPHLVNFEGFVSVFRGREVNSFSSDDAGYGSFGTVYSNSLSTEDSGIDTSDWDESDESVFVNCVDHESDFVDVAGEHDPDFGFFISNVVLITVYVFVDFIDVRFAIAFANFLYFFFKS